MPHAAPPPDPTADSELLARCLQGAPESRTLLLDQLCAEHPERASSLRQLYGLLDEFGFVDEPPDADADDAGGAPSLAPPERVGPYRILSVLGSGGMGIVYLAEHHDLGRRVALKVIHGALARTEKARARFRREALLASRLDDPRICPIYEIGEAADGTPFLVMRHVPGQTLAAAIATSRTNVPAPVQLPARSGDHGLGIVLHFAEDVALALHKAHTAGLVHRDVKPGNLMVTPEGEPVLLDFGLAQDAEEGDARLTQTGDQLGTPHYMAPEQIAGSAVDARTDVYALGVTLYECLTGQPPFQAPRRHDLASQILSAEVPDPRRRQRAIGRELWTVLQTALAKQPAHRYATAAAFAEDLRRLRRNEPILAQRAGPARRLVRFTQRHPFAATAMVGLSAVAFAFAVLVEQRGTALTERTAALFSAQANERALRATASARTAPATALADAIAAVEAQPTVDAVSALYEILPAHHERLRLRHGGATWRAEFTADGQRIVTTSDDGGLTVFDRQGNRLRRTLHNLRPGRGARAVRSLEFAPAHEGMAGRFSTSSDDGSARVFDGEGNQLLLLDHRTEHNQKGRVGDFTAFFAADTYPEVNDARWSLDATRIATSCSDRLVRVWDATTGAKLCELAGHETPMVKLAWSSRGWLASVDDLQDWSDASATFAVLVWQPNGAGYTRVHRLQMPNSMHRLAWAPDGHTLVGACHDGNAYVWDLASGNPAPTRLRHGGAVRSATFSADGTQILTACDDGLVRVWPRTGEPPAQARHDGPVLDAAFAGGTPAAGPLRILSTSRDQTVRVFDERLQPLHVLRGHNDMTVRASLSPDGRQLVTTSWDDTARVWDLIDPELPRLLGHQGRVRALVRLPDGTIASVGDDRTARVWDLRTAQSRTFALAAMPWSATVSADGARLLVAGEDATVRVHDVATGGVLAEHASPRTQWAVGALLADGRTVVAGRTTMQVTDGVATSDWANVDNALYALAAAPHRGMLAGVGRLGAIQLWRDTGEVLPRIPLPERVTSGALAWSPDESRLAAGGATGGAICVWDVPADARRAPDAPMQLADHGDAVHAVAWSPNGQLLAAAVGDGTVHLWNALTGTRIAILRGHGAAAVRAVVFARDDLLLSGGADGAIQAWVTSVDRLLTLAKARLPLEVVGGGPGNDWAFLLGADRLDEAHDKGQRMVDDAIRDRSPHRVWWIASVIVDPWRPPMRHAGLLALAERAVAKAIELAQPPDDFMFATMARVWFCKGDVQKAIEWQTRSVEATPRYRVGDRQLHEEELAEYRKLAGAGR